MGFFDDITNFVNEVKVMGNEMNQLKSDVIQEIKSESTAVGETLQTAASEISETVGNVGTDLRATIHQPVVPQTDPVSQSASNPNDS